MVDQLPHRLDATVTVPSGRHRAQATGIRISVRAKLNDGFLRNTICMTASTLVLGLGGLVFWVMASRTYSVSQIGVATSIIAALTLFSSLASVGWPQLATRDGSSYERGAQILLRAACAIAAIGVAIVLVVQLAPGHFGIALEQVGGSAGSIVLTCVITVVLSAIGSTAEGVLISRHAGHLVLCDSVVGVGMRLGSVMLLSSYGTLGILMANALAAGVSAAAAWGFVTFRSVAKLLPYRSDRVGTWSSDATFVVSAGLPSVVSLIPATLLPTVILHTLGSESAAFFAIAVALSSAVRLMPSVVAQAMLTEVGRGADPRRLLARALRLVAAVSVGVCVAVVLGRNIILSLYSSDIARGAGPVLAVLVVSGTLAGANYLIDGTLLALGELRRFTVVNVAGAAVVVVLVTVGSLWSLEFAAAGFLAAELLYAAASWYALRTSASWKLARDLGVVVPELGAVSAVGTESERSVQR